ncbi:hypothetical protein VRU48_05330 [Pedobacter sp. KR3-3]|uniref:TonB C-terminal domain-containing protein n=1 Tax=Pedobacter albus TaxID=3113905 RepID=A0ABU7I4Y6_9SPHI|nr:hypothetical protein [Pedobacter sp. KR3-3]MEE1944520.1 hypothetical protein [Pedobacter sp. KR3-3]
MFRLFLVLLCLGSNLTGLFAQTPPNESEVQQAVVKTINELLAKPSFKNKLQRKFPGIRGQATIDLGINDKGKAVSFYVVAQDMAQTDFIDFLSGQILSCQFPIKLDKHKLIKIRHTLRIEN